MRRQVLAARPVELAVLVWISGMLDVSFAALCIFVTFCVSGGDIAHASCVDATACCKRCQVATERFFWYYAICLKIHLELRGCAAYAFLAGICYLKSRWVLDVPREMFNAFVVLERWSWSVMSFLASWLALQTPAPIPLGKQSSAKT